MHFNKIYLLLFLIITGLSCHSQTIIQAGYVSGTWDAEGSPYLVQDSIVIHEDSSLFILEGVDIEFADSAFLKVYGYISAVGLQDDSITFRAAADQWQGIRIFHSDSVYNNNLLFYFCSFINANSSPLFENGGALMIKDRHDISIFNCSFLDNYAEYRGGAIYLYRANIQLRNISFKYNSTGNELGLSKGGAIYVFESEPGIEELWFERNESVVAGAFYSENSSIDIKECVFKSNSSFAGGGAFVAHKSGVLAFDDCLFEDNYANGSGGAVAILEGVWARFRNCSIIDNTSETEIYLADGGGVLITPYDNEVSFINCEISNNQAGDYGGGVYATSDTDFIGCLFDSNIAGLDNTGEGGGGAIIMSLSHNEILNCTFAGNYGGFGSTILCEDASFSMVNSILWDDSLGADSKIYLSTIEEPPVMNVHRCDIEGGIGVIRGTGAYTVNWAADNISVDPLFEQAWLDFSLSNESPCIDTGRTDTLQLLIPSKDLAGNPRIYRQVIDLGCYENQFPFNVEELYSRQDILLFPNPTSDVVNLKTYDHEQIDGRLILTDLSGKELCTKHIKISNSETYRMSLSGIPSGFYIISLYSEKQHFTQKLIIQ